MTLATATPDGAPAARIVLLKGADARGFVFYTNKESRKGEELAANARAALLFHWKPLGRQVRIEGRVERRHRRRGRCVLRDAPAHFAPRRLGVGPVARAAGSHRAGTAPGGVRGEVSGRGHPTPAALVGLPHVPERFEFWQNMPFRLHDRTVYTRAANGGWAIGKLFP